MAKKELLSLPFNLRQGAGNGPTTNWNTHDDQVQYAVAMVGDSFHFLLAAFHTEAEATEWMNGKQGQRTKAEYGFKDAYVTTRAAK